MKLKLYGIMIVLVMTLDTLRMTCCSYKKYILLSMVIILPHGWDNNDITKFNKEYLNFLNSSHI